MKVLFLPNIIEEYMNKSKSKFESGKELYKLGYYGDSISHFYYSMLLATRALLFKKGIETKTHKGTINKLYECYVDKGSFNEDIYKTFARTQSLREKVDYDPTDNVSKTIAKQKLGHCESFLKEVEKHI